MAGAGLLARIRDPRLATARRAISDEEVRDSILQNLRAMCSTRLGSAQACPEYGILAVSDIIHSCPDALGQVSKAIRKDPQLLANWKSAQRVRRSNTTPTAPKAPPVVVNPPVIGTATPVGSPVTVR